MSKNEVHHDLCVCHPLKNLHCLPQWVLNRSKSEFLSSKLLFLHRRPPIHLLLYNQELSLPPYSYVQNTVATKTNKIRYQWSLNHHRLVIPWINFFVLWGGFVFIKFREISVQHSSTLLIHGLWIVTTKKKYKYTYYYCDAFPFITLEVKWR